MSDPDFKLLAAINRLQSRGERHVIENVRR